MKRAIDNAVEYKAMLVKADAQGSTHLAKVVAAKNLYSKVARQAVFKQKIAILQLSPVEAVDRARLIPAADAKAFRIVRMPG